MAEETESGHGTEAVDFESATPCCTPHWGWVIVAASFTSLFFMLGISYSVGLYYVEWVAYFQTLSSIASWTGSLQLGLTALLAPLASYLAERFGDRAMVIVAGAISSAGLIASSFVTNIYLMIFTFGAVTGTGFSLACTVIFTVPMYHFKGRSAGIALGVALSGGGCGSFIMPLVIESLIHRYGWQGSLLLLGGMCLNVCVCGALLRPPAKAMTTKAGRSRLNWTILRNVNLTLHIVHQVFFSIGLSVVYVHIPSFIVVMTGCTRSQGGYALITIGVSSFIGRLFHGTIGGLQSVNVVSLYLASYAILGASLLIAPSLPYYPVLIGVSGVFGFFGSAPYATLNQLIITEYAGLENLKFGYGLMVFMVGVGSTSGAPIAGLLYDVTNDYRYSMYFGGGSIILCVVMMIKPLMNATCLPPKTLQGVEEIIHREENGVREVFISDGIDTCR